MDYERAAYESGGEIESELALGQVSSPSLLAADHHSLQWSMSALYALSWYFKLMCGVDH